MGRRDGQAEIKSGGRQERGREEGEEARDLQCQCQVEGGGQVCRQACRQAGARRNKERGGIIC